MYCIALHCDGDVVLVIGVHDATNPPHPPYFRSQAVCHAVQKVCEPECSRQGAGSAGGGGAIL